MTQPQIEVDWQLSSPVTTYTPSCTIHGALLGTVPYTQPLPIKQDQSQTNLYRLQLPFGHGTTLDPGTIDHLQCTLTATDSDGASVSAPYVSISLGDMGEALEELMHPSVSGPLQLNVLSCSVYDTLMVVSLNVNRRASIQVTATDTADTSTSVKATGSIDTGNSDIAISPLIEGQHKYTVALQELDAANHPIGDVTTYNTCQPTKDRITPPNVQINGVSVTPTNVSFSVSGLAPGDHLYYEIVKANQIPSPPNPTKVDAALQEITGDPTQTAKVAYVVGDSKSAYNLYVTAQRKEAPTPAQAGRFLADYRSDILESQTFNGLDALITDSFQLTLQPDYLLVSAKTSPVVAKLAATFTTADAAGDKAKVDNLLSSAQAGVDPSFQIALATLGQPTAGAGPTFYLKLTDNNGREQDARITLAVSTTVPKSSSPSNPNPAKAQSDVNQAVNAAQQGKQNSKVNWGSVLQTGLGAILKYFAVAL
jgi:hypothetical protein